MATVLLLGTLDTKGQEYAYVRSRLHLAGVETLVVDAGILGSPGFAPDVSREDVAAAAGATLDDLAGAGDRGHAVSTMASGATKVVADLYASGAVQGAIALGGTGGSSLAAEAFRLLPLGFPKLIVSTAASGDTRPYIGESDLILVPSVTDVAGVNRLSAQIMNNAAAAIAGMALAQKPSVSSDRQLIAASMFGVTTACVRAAQARLEADGFEVLVFHMTGTGGRVLEQIARDGWLDGVLDVTTTELADELVGGVFSAGSERLTAAGRRGIPQVVSVGALDMVNFGAIDTVPREFAGRTLHVHNPTVTLMRTTPDECAELGRRLASRVAESTGPTTVFLPLRGISAIAVEGGPFFDPAADEALFGAIRVGLAGTHVELLELDMAINDPAFADAMATRLIDDVKASRGRQRSLPNDANIA